MKKLFELLGAGGIAIVAVIIAFIIAAAFLGLIFWGIGSFIVWTFQIPYNWTYFHGVATYLIIWILQRIFKKDTTNIEIK